MLNNGAHTSSSQPDPWADGITLLKCGDGATVNNNRILDATDVGIAGGGTGSGNPQTKCTIAVNTIKQVGKGSFAGIGVAYFGGEGNGNGHWGASEIRNNTINGRGKMDFGIHAGKHAWDARICVDGGKILDNTTLKKSFINLSIDGWKNGVLAGNTPTTAQSPEGGISLGGIRDGDNCDSLYPTDYTVADDDGTGNYQNQSGTPRTWTMHYFPGVGGTCNLSDTQDNCCCRNTENECITCPESEPASYYDDKEH